MKTSFLLQHTLLACTLCLVVAGQTQAASPYPMASGDYLETFDTIGNWEDDFEFPRQARYWGSVPINPSGTIPDGVRTTTGTATFAGLAAAPAVGVSAGRCARAAGPAALREGKEMYFDEKNWKVVDRPIKA